MTAHSKKTICSWFNLGIEWSSWRIKDAPKPSGVTPGQPNEVFAFQFRLAVSGGGVRAQLTSR
jgi:hypothetical protein